MSEREICGACHGPWPCDCGPRAVPVVIMGESVDDALAGRMAARMGNDPLALHPYDPDPPIRDETWQRKYGGDRDFCGHYDRHFDLDTDKRVVSCRACGTALDPYDVLAKLAGMLKRKDERLKAAQDLERREAAREADRLARARVRRHRYAPTSRRGAPEYCATCAGPADEPMHEGAAEPVRRRRKVATP